MDSSNQLKQLEAHNSENTGLVTFLIRNIVHSEHYDAAVVLATTLIILATASFVIHGLQRYRQVERVGPSNHSEKTFGSPLISGQIDALSFSLKDLPTQTLDQLAGELHAAANKCYITKYAARCIDLVEYCPLLVNKKCGSTGLTPFHRVCFHGDAILMEFMLSKGADPFLTTDAGENAICLAVYSIVYKKRNIDEADISCLNILHRAGCTLEDNSIWYDMLMQMALRRGKVALAEWLIANRKVPK